MKTGYCKKNGAVTPPVEGGFSFIRALAAVAAAVVAVALVAVLQAPLYSAVAQTAPGRTSGDTDSLVRELVTLDGEIKGLGARLFELEEKSGSLAARIDALEGEATDKRARLASRRAALADRARNLYVNGRGNTLILLLSSRDVSEFFKRQEYVQKVNERDAEMVDTVRRQAEELDATLAELKRSKKEVDAVASELEGRRDRLAASRSERADVLARAGEASGRVQEQSQQVTTRMDRLNPPVPTGNHTGRILVMSATAYSPLEPGLTDATASGLKAQRGVVAVDPRVIPLGTRVHVEGYGYAIAADTGSAIKGMKIDLCFDTLAEVNAYGRRNVRVEILD